MRKKDIVSLVFCAVIIAGSIYFILKMNVSGKPKPVENTQPTEPQFMGELDKYEEILENVETHTDYGAPALENIGREDPFAGI